MNERMNEIIECEQNLSNFTIKELENYVELIEKRYYDIVVTKESVVSLKKNRADMNKLLKALDLMKKNMKNEILEPYKNLFAEYDGYIERINECKNNIDVGIKTIEQKEREEKVLKMNEFFNELQNFSNFDFTFDDIFDPSWLNKSVSEKKWKQEINNAAVVFQNFKNSKKYEEENENLIFSVKLNNSKKDKLIQFLYENNIDFSIIDNK